MLVLFGASGNMRVLFRKNTDDTGSDFIVNDGFVICANNVNTEFLVNVREIDQVEIDYETTYDYDIGLEFIRFALKPLWTQTLAVDECAV
jgi:hypothetical protein